MNFKMNFKKANKILLKYIYRILYPLVYKLLEKKNTKLPNSIDSKEFLNRLRIHKPANFNVVNSIEKQKYDLTIVVPVYNVERYIEECIESLLNQKTKYKYIIKLVNDGSSDSSKQIIQKFVNNPKIQYLEKENGGQSSARNFGIKNLESDYVLFVDSDDVVGEDLVECLLDEAYLKDLLIVEANYYYFDKNTNVHKLQKRKNGNLYGLPVNKVIKSSLLQHFQFEEGYIFEDTCMDFFVHELAGSKVGTVDKYTYGYRRNQNGTSFSSSKNYASLDSILIVPQILDRMIYLNISINERVLKIMLRQVINSYNRYFYMDKNIQKNVFVYICGVFDKYFSECKYNELEYKKLYDSIIGKNFNLYLLALKSCKY